RRGVRVDRELDVAAAGLHAHGPHDGEGAVAHRLVFLVRQGEDRGDGDRVAGVHAHRVDVLDAADDDAVVLLVADDLKLVFLPTQDRLVDLDLADHALAQAAGDDLVELLGVVGDAAAAAAQGEGGADDGGEADLLEELAGVGEVGDGLGGGDLEAKALDDL